MNSGPGFLSGLCDFLLAPVRLWHMHRRLVQMNPKARAMVDLQHHQMERARRSELRSRMMDSYSPTRSTPPPPRTPPSLSIPEFTFSDPGGLFQPLVRMWIINVGLILMLTVLSSMITFVGSKNRLTAWMRTSMMFQVVSNTISCILHIGLPLFMELVNMLFLKKICDRISLLKSKSCREGIPTNLNEQPLGATVMDRLYALVFFLLFQIQWNLITTVTSNYKLSNLINVFAVAFMYACYAIEYRWRQAPGRTFEGFLIYIVECWTYFVGYGFMLGLGSLFFPHFIGWGGMLLSITYPILVIGALGIQQPPPPLQNQQQLCWLERHLSWIFRYPLIWSMKPALLLTNWLVRGSVALAYQMWF